MFLCPTDGAVFQKNHIFTCYRSDIYTYNRYLKTGPYLNTTLCQNFKVIGEEISNLSDSGN